MSVEESQEHSSLCFSTLVVYVGSAETQASKFTHMFRLHSQLYVPVTLNSMGWLLIWGPIPWQQSVLIQSLSVTVGILMVWFTCRSLLWRTKLLSNIFQLCLVQKDSGTSLCLLHIQLWLGQLLHPITPGAEPWYCSVPCSVNTSPKLLVQFLYYEYEYVTAISGCHICCDRVQVWCVGAITQAKLLAFNFILDPSSRILHPGSFILDPSSWILHPRSFILDPSSWILHPRSFILDPSSWILHPGSFILDPSSWILHPRSFILDPSSWILHPGSFTLDPSSWILHPRSFILDPSSWILHTGSFILVPSS